MEVFLPRQYRTGPDDVLRTLIRYLPPRRQRVLQREETQDGTTVGNDCALFVGLNFGTNNQSAILGWNYNSTAPFGWVGLYGANHLLQWTNSMLTSLNPFTVPYVLPGQLYSVAAVSLPPCTAALQGADAKVKDATAPTYMAPYAGNGGITAAVICSYNGTSYQWLTH